MTSHGGGGGGKGVVLSNLEDCNILRVSQQFSQDNWHKILPKGRILSWGWDLFQMAHKQSQLTACNGGLVRRLWKLKPDPFPLRKT